MKELCNKLEATRHRILQLQDDVVKRESGQQQSQQVLEESHSALLLMLEDMEEARGKIEQAHQEWVTALDAIDDPIFLHDKNFCILRVNRAYQRSAGIPFEEIIGRPYYEVFPKTDGPLPSCRHALEVGKWAEEECELGGRVYRSRAFVVHGAQGEYLHSVHSLEDVSERKSMQQLVHSTNALLHSVIENAPVRIFWKDTNLNYLGCNTAFARDAGWSCPQELHGKDDFQMGWREQADLYRADDRRVMESDTPKLGFEEPQSTPDGRTIWLRTSKVPMHDAAGKVNAVLGIYEDITEHKQHESVVQRANRALRTISAGNQVLIHADDEQHLLSEMCAVAVQIGGYRMAWVGYVEQDAVQPVRPMAQAGFDDGYLAQACISWGDNEHGQGPTGLAVRSGQTQVAQNIAHNPNMLPWRAMALQRGYKSSIAMPLMEDGQCFGTLTMYAAEADAFNAEEVKLLEEMAGDLAYGILNLRVKQAHQAQEQLLQTNMLQTVKAIASIVEMRDPYTSGHQARVAEVACAIARQMALPEDQVQALHLAGLVHDLGKIRIPAEILSKPGKLNAIEYSMIKMHPQAAFDILKDIDFSWPIAQMVLQHHERMDGSGYPQGLKGEEILLGARILCVADVIEAMSSHRPYRPGLGADAALDEIIRMRGTLYDAQVVDACVALFREHAYVMPK